MADDKSLRVTVLGLNYAPETTGIAPYTTAFARHLAEAHHDVTVVAGHPHYPEWRLRAGYEAPRGPENDHGVRLIRVPHPVPRNPTGISRVWMEVVFAVRCLSRLLESRPRVVVVVSPALLALAPALLLRPLLHHRVGVIVQDLYGAAVSETGLGGSAVARATSFLEKHLLKRADGIVVIHDVFKRRLLEASVPEERIEVIPNWAHVQMPRATKRAETRRRLGWGDGDFIALHAGNMGAKQGLEGLIDVARLAAERDSRIRIVLMGDGSRKAALASYARGVNRLTLIESLPEGEFEDALAAADCLLLHEKPGILEMSVPSKLTTYFAAGKPVVAATDPRSGAAALVAASKAGLHIPSGNAAAILGAVEQLAEGHDCAQAFGENGRNFAAAHLSQTASLQATEAWVRNLRD
jgi:colanic acid biosynthesis glycosyl transferase WcaI